MNKFSFDLFVLILSFGFLFIIFVFRYFRVSLSFSLSVWVDCAVRAPYTSVRNTHRRGRLGNDTKPARIRTPHRIWRIHHKHSYDQCKAFAVVFTRNACHNHRMGKRERRESVTYLYVRMRKSEEKESRTLPKLHNHYNNYSAINASAKITIDQVADGGNGIQRTNMCIVWMCYCWREHTSLIEHRDALYDSHIQSHNR